MPVLKLGSSSDMSLIRNGKAKDVLNFLENGTIVLCGSTYIPLDRCVCGKLPKYVKVDVRPLKYMYCDVNVSFLCEACFHGVDFRK